MIANEKILNTYFHLFRDRQKARQQQREEEVNNNGLFIKPMGF